MTTVKLGEIQVKALKANNLGSPGGLREVRADFLLFWSDTSALWKCRDRGRPGPHDRIYLGANSKFIRLNAYRCNVGEFTDN
jgi:hypothetical protein